MPCLLPSPSKLPVLSSQLKFLPHSFKLLLNLPPPLPPALPPVRLFPILYYLMTSYSYLLHLVKYILLRGYICYTVISHTAPLFSPALSIADSSSVVPLAAGAAAGAAVGSVLLLILLCVLALVVVVALKRQMHAQTVDLKGNGSLF